MQVLSTVKIRITNIQNIEQVTGLVAEPDKVLVGELNEWVANPQGPGQTSALQIKTRSAYF